MGRLRSMLRLVGLRRVVVALICGFFLTVLTSWWIALDPQGVPFPIVTRSSDDRWWTVYSPRLDETYWLSEEVSPAQFTVIDTTPIGSTAISSTTRMPELLLDRLAIYDNMPRIEQVPGWISGLRFGSDHLPDCVSLAVQEFAYGWPFRAFTNRSAICQQNGRLKARVNRGAITLPQGWVSIVQGRGRDLPFYPVFPGILLNTLIYGAPVYLMLLSLAGVRRVYRWKRGKCLRCGYALKGVTAQRCPECGNPKP